MSEPRSAAMAAQIEEKQPQQGLEESGSHPGVPDAFICVISGTGQMMKDPYMTEAGHSYEGAEIKKWLATHDTDPATNQKLKQPYILMPNTGLKKAMAAYDELALENQALKYKVAALEGDAEAQYNLGKCYLEGKGVKRNPELAFMWAEKSATQGNAKGLNTLGYCYQRNIGVKPDEDNARKAFELYAKSAELGCVNAQSNLGLCLFNGRGTTIDYDAALQNFNKAAIQGSQSAQCSLSNCYRLGKGTQIDHAEANIWARKAAEQGHMCAAFDLGVSYDIGRGVAAIDREEAAKWYQIAADKGHADAQFNLGKMYIDNYFTDVPNYFEIGFSYLLKAANQGQVNAQIDLTSYYEKLPVGGKQNMDKAFEWAKKSVEKERVPEAYYNLAYIYEVHKKDLVRAIDWYKKCAELGFEKASKALKRLGVPAISAPKQNGLFGQTAPSPLANPSANAASPAEAKDSEQRSSITRRPSLSPHSDDELIYV